MGDAPTRLPVDHSMVTQGTNAAAPAAAAPASFEAAASRTLSCAASEHEETSEERDRVGHGRSALEAAPADRVAHGLGKGDESAGVLDATPTRVTSSPLGRNINAASEASVSDSLLEFTEGAAQQDPPRVVHDRGLLRSAKCPSCDKVFKWR